MAFNLGMNAKQSIQRSAGATPKGTATDDARQPKASGAKPSKSKNPEETVRFQAFMSKSLKRRLKLFAASEDITATQAMDMLLSDALTRRGA